MLYFTVAFGLLAHVFFWGAGLALWAMPRPWRRYWPVLTPVAGIALQATVVWIGAYADLPGTRSYGWASELIPGLLLFAGLGRRGRRAVADVQRLGGVWLIVGASLAALVWPLARASRALTTTSLGSCDSADFAAGGRVLMEFAHHDRTGFLGLTEVVRVLSVDNFFDFWLRINHFTPAALIALNGTIFGLAPYQITGILTAVILVAAIPVVFWMARAVMGYRGWASVAVAALYAFSPILWYAVYHAAMGQLLAAPGIALITWIGVAAWRRSLGQRQRLALAGVLAIGYTLVLASYNFIVVFCLIPAVAYAFVLAIWQRRGLHLVRWLLTMLLPLAVVGTFFWARVAGVFDRFALFQAYDFGWRIPALTPEGWLGLVHTVRLEPLPELARWVLAALAVGALLGALWSGARRADRTAFVSACLFGPIALGYGFLRLGGIRIDTHTSYDSYKLMAVFYAGLLPAICYWLRPTLRRRSLPVLGICLLVGAELLVARRFQVAMENPPLIVDRNLVDLGRIESMPAIGSLNMRIPDMWSRLWASQFLLRRPQYFPTHTYEGHVNTPLRGLWDLRGGLVTVVLPGADTVRLNRRYVLTRADSLWRIRAIPRRGWHAAESLPCSNAHWRWTAGNAGLEMDNPQGRLVSVIVRLDARSLVDRDLQLWRQGRCLGTVHLGLERSQVSFPAILLPPGRVRLELRSSQPPLRAPGDTRLLGSCCYGIVIEVLKLKGENPTEGEAHPMVIAPAAPEDSDSG